MDLLKTKKRNETKLDSSGLNMKFLDEQKSTECDPSTIKIKISFESPANLEINEILEVGHSWGVYRAFEALMHLMTPSITGVHPLRIANFTQKTDEKGFLCGELKLEVSNLKEAKKDEK